MEYPKSRIWEFIGKFSTILAALAALISILTYVFKNSADIEAIGYIESYTLPPDIENALNKVREKTNYVNIEKHFRELIDKHDISCNKNNCQVILNAIEKYYDDVLPHLLMYRSDLYRKFAHIEIYNTGSLEAKNLVLDLNDGGIASITYRDGAQKVIHFEKKISLGSIRPNNSIYIDIWYKNGTLIYTKDKFFVTYDGGVEKVSIGKLVYGFSRFLDDYFIIVISFIPMLCFAVYCLIQIFISSPKFSLAKTISD